MELESYLRIRLAQSLALHLLLSELDDSLLLWHDLLTASVQNFKKRINLLLVGKTGHGKSATGNSTLGRKEFESKASASSVTSEVKCGQVQLGDYLVNVIDSPGLSDTNFLENKIEEVERTIENMEKVITLCPDGIQAFVFVVKFGNRYTNEEHETFQYLQNIFGPNFLKDHGIIVFTHGDEFENAMEDEGMTQENFHDWCRKQEGIMGNLMKECGYRCLLFNNREKNDEQKQTQMEGLVCLALDFKDTYTNNDFLMCKKLRHKFLLEFKAPELKKEFQSKIDTLNQEIELVCGPGNMSIDDFLSLTMKTVFLDIAVHKEDGNTGLLGELTEQIQYTKKQILFHKKKQEAKRLCKIL